MTRFFVGGIGDQLAVHRSYPHAAQHMGEGDVGDGERGASADNGQRAGIALRVGREHHGDDLRLVHEAFGKQRPDGPVDETAGQDFFFRGASLALDEAARKLAGGVSIFAIIHGERKKGRVRFRFFVGAGANQHDGVARAHQHGPVGLLGYLPRFEGYLLTVQVNFNCV